MTYERIIQGRRYFEGDAVVRGLLPSNPLQYMISGKYMDTETFCLEWMDNRDEILKIYDVIVDNHRKLYPIVAESPVSHVNYGGNVTVEIIGLENFEKYYIPSYNEAAEIMREHGKLTGSHFDANCKVLSKAIAESELDYVEAFTPYPDTDMTLKEAREAWPDKILWLNFPSSMHLESDDKIENTTVELLNELDSVDGVIMGITEKMPETRWRNSCRAIMDGLNRHSKENPTLYDEPKLDRAFSL